MLNKLLTVALLSAVCLAQDYEEYQPAIRQASGASRYVQEEQKTEAPIAILKQINKHNEDGSYTYGYEGADGSFKIETKDANGDVKGKYGYTDGDGKVRVVEYGANKYGFQPSGEGITVAPINYNEVKEADYEEAPQQYVARPKQSPKPARPAQSFNFAPAPVEQRKPVYAATPTPQYYEYEEETPTTPRPVQFPRPKYAVPTQQPQQPRPQQPQYQNEFEFFYSPEQGQAKAAPQYQQFENRQPVQFPAETEAPAVPSLNSRSEQFGLFSPASRADTFRPKFNQFEQEPFQFAPQPSQQPKQPAPQQAYQRPSFASQPAQSRTTSVLDQLAKDPNYALPQSSPSLHDISFGYSV